MSAAVKTIRIGNFDPNPRGDLWVKDKNKIGQKLLCRMGWSEGKGLGKHEDGITDCVKVRMRVRHSGVGFTKKLPLGLENDAYNAVLESLNKKFKTNGETKKVDKDSNGLERRSQQFKKRLHYQKFVRGKDVGRYSEKDMNSIFGTRKPEPAAAPLKSNVTNVDLAPPENSETFKSQLSMKDYFAMKLKKKSGEAPPLNLCTSNSEHTNSTSPENGTQSKKRKREKENNTKTSKRLKSKQSDTSERNTEESIEIPTDVKKEKKNRKSKWAGKLKSCLKNKLSSGLWFKQETKEVSFNDSVSFRIIENVLNQGDEEVESESNQDEEEVESDSNQVIENVLNQDDEEVENVSYQDIENVLDEDFMCNGTEHHPYGFEEDTLEEGEYVDEDPADDNTVGGDGCSLEELNDNLNHTDNNATGEQSRSVVEDLPKCLDLPRCDNSNYNAWLESQRIAIKMKLYKNMVKKMRKNPVLRTSSILDLKGYGNWGF